MSISEKDREFMQAVADYYVNTRSETVPKGSINETAKHFGLTRTKVTKILVTMGEYVSPLTKDILKLRAKGLSVMEIADRLDISVGTVSSYLPYSDEYHGTEEPSKHTAAMREYRSYEKAQAKRQIQNKIQEDKHMKKAGGKTMDKENESTNWKSEWQKEIKMSYTETPTRPRRATWNKTDREYMKQLVDDTGLTELFKEMYKESIKEAEEYQSLCNKESLIPREKTRRAELEGRLGMFSGALADRNRKVLEEISGDSIPFEPMDILHLHLELVDEWDEEELQIAKKYGKLNGCHISRDVVVPADIPLYAVHYLIQRLFGWQNSHLHSYELDYDDFVRFTGNCTALWEEMVGIVLRSPFMKDDDVFWADDYSNGSFKNWLTRKYTGPYMSQCRGEGIISCVNDKLNINKDERFYVMTGVFDGIERVVACYPAFTKSGKMTEPPKERWKDVETKTEVRSFIELPVDALRMIFQRNPVEILERLPINTILKAQDTSEKFHTAEELHTKLRREVRSYVTADIDSPECQVLPVPVTDTLYYNYDFGDNWVIRITASRNCEDMVKNGIVTQEQLDKANIKCRELYRPVTIAVDGEMLIDDMGGCFGFINFLKALNPELSGMDTQEKADARAEKKDYMEWAKSQGWHKLSPWI